MKPPLDPHVADLAPSHPTLTRFDEEHVAAYRRQVDANADGADWPEVSRIVLHIVAEREPDRAARVRQSPGARQMHDSQQIQTVAAARLG
jgi:hypothetical protein